jgi:uncharacterized protein YyaL (SSP411 family)
MKIVTFILLLISLSSCGQETNKSNSTCAITNQLIQQSSPYLLQYALGDEDKLIIDYSNLTATGNKEKGANILSRNKDGKSSF